MRIESTIRSWLARCVVVIVLASGAAGCADRVPPRVVVYTSVDREIAQPIFDNFVKTTGIRVHAAYGTDPARSRSLAREIVAHRSQSRCDVFWNRAIFDTLWLEREDLLRAVTPPAASDFPAATRSPQHNWYGVTTDARILVVNTRQIAESRLPKSIEDLTDPQWYERTAIARPVQGASATHAACIFQAWGDTKAEEFYLAVKRNARILETDRDVAHAVATGSLAFGLANASDAARELAAGGPIAIVYPDQSDGQLGTLFIPSTIALLKDSPDAEPADRLLDYLLSSEVAQRLAESPIALVTLNTGVPASKSVKTPAEVRTMEADFQAAAENWDTTVTFLQSEFTGQ